MSEELIKQLHRKRGGIKGKLTNVETFLQPFLAKTRQLAEFKQEIKLRQASLQDIKIQFDTIQTEIECSCEETMLSNEYNERSEFEDKFYKIAGLMMQFLEEHTNADDEGQSVRSERQSRADSNEFTQARGNTGCQVDGLRLPTIHLPKFSGNFTKWLEFKDIYNSLIHENKNISTIQKFHYLRASLEDSAAQVIQSIEFAAVNYDTAWELLCERYDNNYLLVHNHIKAIFDTPTISKDSSMSFRQMVDDVSKHMHSLDVLQGREETFDAIIIYILLNKLDIKTTKEWEEKRQKEGVTLTDFKEFLKGKADLLETIEARTQKCTEQKGSSQHNKQQHKHKSFATSILACNYCKENHPIYQCEEFLKLAVNDRVEQVKKLNLCYNCLRTGHSFKSCTVGSCKKCKRKHNTLLHVEKESTEIKSNEETTTFNASCRIQGHVLLATATITVYDCEGRAHNCRVMLDSGSQSHFITTSLCQRLGLNKMNTNISIVGINQVSSKVRFECQVRLKSNIGSFKTTITCFVIDTISDNATFCNVDIATLDIPENIALADLMFGQPGEIDLLLGGALFWEILKQGRIILGPGKPVLQNTALGWIVAGNLPISKQLDKVQCHFNETINLQRFWEIEEYPTPILTIQDQKCEDLFATTTTRDLEGRFVVALPLNQDRSVLGESRTSALKRFLALEQRLQQKPQLQEAYTQFMKEYETLGHMSPVDENQECQSYYLPHHGVLREDSLTTKLRVVFDGSAPSDKGISLNDIQYTGPNLQQDLIAILLQFRQHQYVFIADITKMYRQISVREEDRPLQKILWRYNPNEVIQEYQLNTVTYGTRSAPYLAMRCLKQLATENEVNYPEAAEIIRRDFYMDDLISGSQTIQGAAILCKEINQILESAGFELRKWSSNHPKVLEDIDATRHTSQLLEIGEEKCKTLGLQWACNSDTLSYKINGSSHSRITKRSILSEVSQIFDPLGLLSPWIIRIKILLQKLWLANLSWDDEVPKNVKEQWVVIRSEMTSLNDLSVPRLVLGHESIRVELHGYCDSSQEAYGACIYVRSITANEVMVQLLCAKTKVAPLKTLTIPRLELCGALLLARLMKTARATFSIQVNCYYWTDSQIVLAWLQLESGILQTFVSNRIAEIQRLTQAETWSHISGKQNPADILSRGVTIRQLLEKESWWHGPHWLSQQNSAWSNSESNQLKPFEIPELKKQAKVFLTYEDKDFPIFERYSSFSKLRRITALCLRFAQNCKSKQSRVIGPISVNELNLAVKSLIKLAQWQSFSEEIKVLRKKGDSLLKGNLQKLSPFLDEEGIIRVGGRLQGSQLGYNSKHPILLSGKHPFSLLLFRSMHIQLLHSGAQMLLYTIRENYWVLRGRNLARKIVRECITCFKVNPSNITPLMGNLPLQRVSPAMPFSITGTDFAGPFLLRDKHGRGKTKYKCYLCIFVCLSTKALHLEPVSDLTTESFIATLKRFIARRGVPSQLHSDNGTTYIKASKDLSELGNFITQNSNTLTDKVAELGITWHFIPPASPNFGGLWEAAVKSIKFHIRRILINECLTFENFLTLLVMIEGILNSRPISPLSSDPNDFRPLTPSHFLMGRSVTSIPEARLEDIPRNRLSLHQHIQQLRQIFWKRWSKEYLAQLQVRSRWTKNPASIPDGVLVLLKENNLPPSEWRLGRVIQRHPGPDGITRVVTVKTSTGVFQRAVTKVCPLPVLIDSEIKKSVSEVSL